jgi:hypothetical protein
VTDYRILLPKKYIISTLPVFIYLFLVCPMLFSQRLVQMDKYSAAYFDSIRALVNDTAKENYTIRAYRLSKPDEIVIDGHLNEAAWKMAEHRSGFLEKEPFPLVPMSEKTEFAILYDEENLYIGVWCWDSNPKKIIHQLAPKGTSAADNVDIFIDSYHDHRTGYKFSVSPTGVQVDELRYDDVKRDLNWDGIWYSAGSIDENGWYAEVKMPFFNLRFSNKVNQTFGFNIMRNISKDASRGQWKPHLPEWDNTTRMSQMGNIENISSIKSGRTFEFRPYGVVGRTETKDQKPSLMYNFGGDIRYSPSPNLTGDFTVNPDFAQVDADVFEINLTRYPTRFKELRPFFTERTSIFNTPRELFYSRRVGARGNIIAGAKVTGKLQHGVEFGILGNLTGESVFSSAMENPESAAFGVMRIKKDILGSSSIGILAATKEGDGNYNRVLGLDGSFVIKSKNILDFQIATGQNELGYDHNMSYDLSYLRTGDLMGVQIDYDRVEPAFEINRIGYIQKETDRGWNKAGGTFRLSPRINKYHIRRIIGNLEFDQTIDLFTTRYINSWLEKNPDLIPDEYFGTVDQADGGDRYIVGGARNSDNLSGGGDLTFNLLNEMSFVTEYKHYSATELTGKYTGNYFKMTYSTRPLKMGTQYAGVFSMNIGTFYNFDQKYVGSQRGFTINGDGQLSNNIITQLQGGYTTTYDPMNKQDGQYFTLSSNSTWMFTKDFFFRLHIQGIFGTTYYDQKQMNNDYLLSCLLSWEYKPGSFMYLAYNEGRYDESNPTTSKCFEFSDRTIIFKISYFFNL